LGEGSISNKVKNYGEYITGLFTEHGPKIF